MVSVEIDAKAGPGPGRWGVGRRGGQEGVGVEQEVTFRQEEFKFAPVFERGLAVALVWGDVNVESQIHQVCVED